jgi:hypothetical protein
LIRDRTVPIAVLTSDGISPPHLSSVKRKRDRSSHRSEPSPDISASLRPFGAHHERKR